MSSTPLFDAVTARRREPSPAPSASVPASLVAAIDAIPQRLTADLGVGLPVAEEQLALVEAVADAVTRAVVDAVAAEVERITRDGRVRV
ncbi:hypothetical protein [Curtobacterium sp. DN_7.5]|uniref:hypothetical protein n=1 Tax=Curtobacterium sp. DN_7.5 TaxID=3049047 RepID=UPI001F580AA5|nr:hypothetical protein [Curtobacterium sp. DN_7.5]